jgi:argininosuccinate lyase
MNVEARLVDEIGDAAASVDELRRALVAQARAQVDTVLPGYTHPHAHHLPAYDAMLARDRGRIAGRRALSRVRRRRERARDRGVNGN